MYTAFYGLREKPFALSPDPRFLYLAGSHREALAHLLYGIEQGEGFISVTGEVGTGKTTLCRTLLERLEGDVELAFLFNPSRSALELLQSICVEFGLPAEGLARRALMAQLNNFLLEKRREGRRVLLIVDEAQTLSEATLEQVRLLSNLETSREKLIQILLLGQPELDRKLDEPVLRQLRQRISVRWQLAPLAPAETRAYVRHRVSIAAGKPRELFTEAALREIHRRTGGVPRLVNQLCDRALLGGYAARAAQVGPRLVRAAAREIPDARRARGRFGRERQTRPWLFFAAALALVGIALVAGLGVGRSGLVTGLRDKLSQDAGPATQGARATGGLAAGEPQPAPGVRPAVAAAPPTLGRPIGPAPPAVGATPAVVPGGIDPVLDREDSDRPTALAPGLLARMVAARDPRSALGATERALLLRFGRRIPGLAPPAANPDALESSLRARGLETTPFERGSFALIRRLDHPVAIALQPDGFTGARGRGGAGEGSPRETSVSATSGDDLRWVAVLGFEGDRARLAGLLEGREVTAPVDELAALWSEAGIVVWERFERIPPRMSLEDEGGPVVWLQRALAELRFYQDVPTGLFDAATEDALVRFQRDSGLVADGVAGPLTQIALFGQLARYPVPRLSSEPIGPTRADASPGAIGVVGGERG